MQIIDTLEDILLLLQNLGMKTGMKDPVHQENFRLKHYSLLRKRAVVEFLTNSIHAQAIFKLLLFKKRKRAYQQLRYNKCDIN